MENIEKVIRLLINLLAFFVFIGFFFYETTREKDYKKPLETFIKDISRSEPDFYTLKLTSDFIDTLLTEYNDKNFIKLEEKKI